MANKTDTNWAVIGDVHFGVNPSYITKIDYPKYVLDTFTKILDSLPPNTHIFLTGDVFHDAGVHGKYRLYELSLLFDLIQEGRLTIVRGNGRHAFDVHKSGDTLEGITGLDCSVKSVCNLTFGLLGFQATQEELDEKLRKICSVNPDYIISHNAATAIGSDPVLRLSEIECPVIFGHDHTVRVSSKARTYGIGSMVNTDFGSNSEHRFFMHNGQLKEVPDVIPFNTFVVTAGEEKIILQDKSVNRVIVSSMSDLDRIVGVPDKVEYRETAAEPVFGETEECKINSLVDNWKVFAANETTRVQEKGEKCLSIQ